MTESQLDDRKVVLLKKLIDNYWKEDQAVRERQIRKWRHLKLLWDGFSRVWWSDVAHDWRVWDNQADGGDGNQDYYDKPVNVFKAYLETIIAALSVLVPPIKCYPDDADNSLDLMTAKAADKIAQLIYRHNNVNLLWLKSLFIYCTEGMVACYNYSKEDKAYGTYEKNDYDEDIELHEYTNCPQCDEELGDEIVANDAPVNQDAQLCPMCEEMVIPNARREELRLTRLVGVTKHPKSRVCMEVWGGLYVKIPNYASKQADCPYLFYSREINFALARARFKDIRDKIQPQAGDGPELYERWGRQNPNYQGEYPENNVTVRDAWFRPESYECLTAEEADELRDAFPKGVRVSAVNDDVAEYEEESLDDHWTITENPLADFLYFDPIGAGLVSTQELTNDIISLTQQTIEHGIPQTFADQGVLDFKAYEQTEATPGGIFPATARAGKTVGDGFYEVKTATLSQEVLPFLNLIQSLGQTVVGAQPSLFGGDISGSKTASEYSMSRAQALQRLQNSWKMFTSWWKIIFSKVVPQYIDEMKTDEKFVEMDDSGNFINTFIKLSELEGKIGNIELEANENLPVTWSQKKDAIMALMESNNQAIPAMLMTPENLPLVYEALGIPDLSIPGMDSRNKQYSEIKVLIETEPTVEEPTPEEMEIGAAVGQEVMPLEKPSVPVEEFDNHQVELEICMKWLNSETGQLAKVENPQGYLNVVLHAREHKAKMMEEMMAMAQQGNAPGEKPKEDTKAPKDVENVPTNS